MSCDTLYDHGHMPLIIQEIKEKKIKENIRIQVYHDIAESHPISKNLGDITQLLANIQKKMA